MDEISHRNLKILKYINKKEPVQYKALIERYGPPSEQRIHEMSSLGYIEPKGDPDRFARNIGIGLTNKGINLLEDHRWFTIRDIRDSVALPVIVAFVTSVVTIATNRLWSPLLEKILSWVRGLF